MTDFTRGKILPQIVFFVIPLFMATIFQQLYNITDSIIAGRFLGPNALATIGATTPIIRFSIALAAGMTLGITVLVAQYFGAGKHNLVQISIKTSFVFFSILAAVITLIGMVFTPLILRALRTPSEIQVKAVSYLRITFLGTFAMTGYNVLNAIYRGIGNSRTPLFVLIVFTVLNIVLDFFFILVLKMGVEGTAFATIICQAGAFFASYYLIHRRYPDLWIKGTSSVFSLRGFDKNILARCLKIGLPSGLKGALYWGGYMLITAAINGFGAFTIAAFAAASRLDSLVQTPIQSIGSGLSTFVGQNIGAKQSGRISSGIRVCVLSGIITALIISVIIHVWTSEIMSFFTGEPDVIKIGTGYLKIVSVFYVIYALQEVIQGLAIGCGNTLLLMISTITAMWVVRIPLVFFMSSRFGVTGIWYSIPVGWFVAMIFTNSYFLSGKWKNKLRLNP